MAASTFNPSEVIIMANAHDTLKNDDYETASITLSGSTPIPAFNRLLVQADVVVGAAGSIADIRIRSSKEGAVDFLASVQVSFDRVDAASNPYTIYVSAFHVNATTVRIQAFAVNPYALVMNAARGDETFTFKIRTYKAPF